MISTSALTASNRWGGGVTVVDTIGDGPLERGHVVLAIDGRDFDTWVTSSPAASRRVGDTVTYRVRRDSSGEGPALDVDMDVSLSRYPLMDAVLHRVPTVVATVLLLVAGSVVFWRRPERAASRACLAAAALIPAGLTSAPWGLGAIDLAGSRGVWPQLVGEVACTLGLGAAVVAPAMGGVHRGLGSFRSRLRLSARRTRPVAMGSPLVSGRPATAGRGWAQRRSFGRRVIRVSATDTRAITPMTVYPRV